MEIPRHLPLVLGLTLGGATIVDYLGSRRIVPKDWMFWSVEVMTVLFVVCFYVARRSRRSAAVVRLILSSLFSLTAFALAFLIFRTDHPLFLKISSSAFYLCFSALMFFFNVLDAWSGVWPPKDQDGPPSEVPPSEVPPSEVPPTS